MEKDIRFISANALAKTQGNSVNFNLSSNNVIHEYFNHIGVSTSTPNFTDSKPGFGFSYKYSFNINDFFVRPGAFFDHLGLKSQDIDGDSVSINQRYGTTIDLGYDFSEKSAIYLTAGIANVDYNINFKSEKSNKSGMKIAPIYGIGFLFYPKEDIVINFEYNHQSFDLKAQGNGSSIANIDSKINSFKIGFGYQF